MIQLQATMMTIKLNNGLKIPKTFQPERCAEKAVGEKGSSSKSVMNSCRVGLNVVKRMAGTKKRPNRVQMRARGENSSDVTAITPCNIFSTLAEHSKVQQ